MKNLLALVLGLVSVSASANATNYIYRCECQDSGYECDGVDFMFLKISATDASFNFADRDGDRTSDRTTNAVFNDALTGNRDSESFENTKYFGFDTKSNRKVYPTLYATAGMVNGAARGFALVPELSQGEEAHVWEFECTRQ